MFRTMLGALEAAVNKADQAYVLLDSHSIIKNNNPNNKYVQ